MAFINDEELEERLKSPDNLVESLKRRAINDIVQRIDKRAQLPEYEEDRTKISPLHNGGRRPGDKNMPEFMQAIVGASANIDTLANTAREFEVSKHHAFELKHGMHSTAQGQNEELVQKVNKELEKPHELAIEKLTKSLLAISDEDLAGVNKGGVANALRLSTLALNVSKIVEKTSPIQKDANPNDGKVQLIVYSPSFKQENYYETIEVPGNSIIGDR